MTEPDTNRDSDVGGMPQAGRFLACLIALQVLSWGYLLAAALLSRSWYDIVFGAGMVMLFLPTPGNMQYLRSPAFGTGRLLKEARFDVALRWMALSMASAGFLARWWVH